MDLRDSDWTLWREYDGLLGRFGYHQNIQYSRKISSLIAIIRQKPFSCSDHHKKIIDTKNISTYGQRMEFLFIVIFNHERSFLLFGYYTASMEPTRIISFLMIGRFDRYQITHGVAMPPHTNRGAGACVQRLFSLRSCCRQYCRRVLAFNFRCLSYSSTNLLSSIQLLSIVISRLLSLVTRFRKSSVFIVPES